MVALALLSCYRLANQKQLFVPIHGCQNYLAGIERLHENGNIGANGSLLERILYSVIKVGNGLDIELLRLPYLQPYQLGACMEETPATLRRLSKCCAHQETVDDLDKLLKA
ncbi:hypothetical protein F5Y19DRAFT_460063 [Xylariaceae sp. FL1651]|nr:hypothetical protein F5Y19DRAFT_460063 [Xylariaceae sp. FL1651]